MLRHAHARCFTLIDLWAAGVPTSRRCVARRVDAIVLPSDMQGIRHARFVSVEDRTNWKTLSVEALIDPARFEEVV